MLVRRFPLGALWTNGYLVHDETRQSFFVDPGGDPTEVLSVLTEKDLQLEHILVTHGHADHIQGIQALRERTGANVWISREDAPLLESAEGNLSTYLGSPFRCGAPQGYLLDGMILTVGSMTVSVLSTPGHTPGSCCLLVQEAEEEVLFSGDTLFARSVGRCDLPGGDEKALQRSLERLSVFSDALRVLPGHGPETCLGVERRENPFWPR